MAVACTTAGGTEGPSTSPPGPCSEIPFDQRSGGIGDDGVRVAAISDTVLCVDPPTVARTKFWITADSDIPQGLRVGDEIFLETLDGRVVRVERDSQTTA